MTTNQILRAWKASFVRRWHTNYELCETVDYDCGHQGRVALLILQLFPDCSRTLLAWAVVHDQGEIAAGDMPAPVKRRHPMIATALNVIEDEEIDAQGFDLPNLTVLEDRKLKLCDKLDGWLWMMRHRKSMYARPEWQAMLTDIQHSAEWLGVGPEVKAVVDEVVTR